MEEVVELEVMDLVLLMVEHIHLNLKVEMVVAVL